MLIISNKETQKSSKLFFSNQNKISDDKIHDGLNRLKKKKLFIPEYYGLPDEHTGYNEYLPNNSESSPLSSVVYYEIMNQVPNDVISELWICADIEDLCDAINNSGVTEISEIVKKKKRMAVLYHERSIKELENDRI